MRWRPHERASLVVQVSLSAAEPPLSTVATWQPIVALAATLQFRLPRPMITSEALQAQALQLCDRISVIDTTLGASRLHSRVKSELVDLASASESRLSGAANNLGAIEWELDVLAWAPSPVAVSHHTQPPSCEAATIDVVAADGHWWLEAKASLPFGLRSTAWVDLKHQLTRITKNARASFCGARRPSVIVAFRHACPAEVH